MPVLLIREQLTRLEYELRQPGQNPFKREENLRRRKELEGLSWNEWEEDLFLRQIDERMIRIK